MSSTPYGIPALVEKINTTSKDLGKDNEEARRQCLEAARSLTFALESPTESILRTGWAEQFHHSALRKCIDLKVFEKLDESDGAAKSSTQLAKMTGADPRLMTRLLKHLATMGSICETSSNEYVSTPFSSALKEPLYRVVYPKNFDQMGPNFFSLQENLSKAQYKNPQSFTDGASQLGHDTKKDHSSDLSSPRPERLLHFQTHVAGFYTGTPRWMDPGFYPVEKNLVDGFKFIDSDVFLVDIGGGKGQDLQDLHQKYPNLPGNLVLQDLESVIKEAVASGLDKKIVAMEYDFFKPQPLRAVRAFYMHAVLHGYKDAQAREILKNQRPGMLVGYSKLLINDTVIPDRGARWLSTAVMVASCSACQRTEESWRALLKSAGFKIVKIWTREPGIESLIEAELI